MKWFINLSTRAKLVFGFGIMWLLLAIVIAVAYRNITGMAQSEKEAHDLHFTVTIQLLQLRSHQNYNRGQMLEMMLTADRSDLYRIVEDIRERSRQMDQIIGGLVKLDPDPNFRSRITEIGNNLAAYRQTRDQEMTLIQGGKLEEARKLAVSVQQERFDKIRSIATELGEKACNDVDKKIAMDLQAARAATFIFVTVGVSALLLAGLMIVFLNQTMVKPLSELTDTAERIATGELKVLAAAGERRDEVGLLVKTFSRMTQSLREMAGLAERIAAGDLLVAVKPQSEKDLLGTAFCRMVERLRRSTADISEAVNVLGSSSAEILSATTQVATGTAETATAISETTTTVEEVRQATQLSSQKSQNVAENAKRVAQISQNGLKAVEETASGMRHIRDQMDSIARTIVRLSEQGQSIGGIIASVTDLADQSNLLAVNAAIEAARAGEQGKGFGVVAQEIRSLAEQSKQATAQVRDILSEVQKATGAAVMATEQGSKAVDSGVQQSAQAGEAIRVLTKSVEDAVQTATQIVASSHQQVVGMDQIGVAMENINQAAAETMASMRQSETAARSLHELGKKLKQLVEQYKV